MTPDQIEALFTRPDGDYAFARWAGRSRRSCSGSKMTRFR